MGSTLTIWTLPEQPLPKSDIKASVFVTIWAFCCAIFVFLFHRKLSGKTPVLAEFKSIRGSAILLTVWYTVTAADRWLHFEQRALPYGYILLVPILQIAQVISAIWFLWGTYKIVWNELERRFVHERSQGLWWLAAKIAIFVVGLVSFFYFVLEVATAVVWLQFLSLNIIADVATKRNNFELAMTAFFTVFGLLTVFATVATIFFRARAREGSWAKTRVYLVLATILLFSRSLMECILVSLARNGSLLQHDAQISYDIAYGLLTSLYLLFMYLQACQLLSKLDMGTSDADNVQSDVRAWILNRLSAATQKHVLTAPPFSSILDEAGRELASILQNGPLSLASTLTPEKKLTVANSYLKQLRSQFSGLAPQPKTLLSDNHRIKRTPVGRKTAPVMPSSSAYESLRSSSNPAIRKPSSVPNMHTNRFAPRSLHEVPSAPSGLWQPNIAPIEELQAQVAYPPVQPFEHRRFAPADPNAPSFSARADAVRGLASGQRIVPDVAVPDQLHRRRFEPQGTPSPEPGPAHAYPPDSYAPQPQAYPAQSYSSRPSPQGYTGSLQFAPRADSQTTLGASSGTTIVPAEVDYQPPQPQRRRFESSRNSFAASPQDVPDIITQTEPSQQRYHPRYAPESAPVQAAYGARPLQPLVSQSGAPRQVYAETVTDSDVASSRSPVNFNYALPDLGQGIPPTQ
ncbi:hypothetical protein B0T14DRAFT_493792 [Immersiella caudata]|uniref:Uncharacterized protein n=1 Tax=Immersiella caudata TaxID=314043 RepID=A0AA39X5Z2_9PEZI|nr:hypothetical protein B0T14DRAFT_493792 [Immersiella caudata]